MLSRTLQSAARASSSRFGAVSSIRAVRSESTSAKVPADVAQATKKDSHQLVVSEPAEVVTADIVSGAPGELRHRAVRIFKPTRSTTQSGGSKGELWRIDFDILQGGGRWENPLMGWASSADYMQGSQLKFKTSEDAVHFAEKQGWDYYIQQPTVKRIPPKNYSENYLYRPGKLRQAHTK